MDVVHVTELLRHVPTRAKRWQRQGNDVVVDKSHVDRKHSHQQQHVTSAENHSGNFTCIQQCSLKDIVKQQVSIHCLGLLERYDSRQDSQRKIK